MSQFPVLPVLVPLLLGALLVGFARAPLALQRAVSFAGVAVLLIVALSLLGTARQGTITVYHLGGWAPPFGIALVVDQLSAGLLVLTALVAAVALLFAAGGEDREGPYFHALFQLQLMGINGAFLTGDLFNLFVFFEVLLIASYGLLLHGRGAARPHAALHVVVLNLVGSALFLFAVGAIYSVTGTLNLADLSRVVPLLAPPDAGIARAGGLLLLVVFALKAALLPLCFWLPRAYAAGPASAVALFALLTKVGAYAILRVHTQVFGDAAAESARLVDPVLLPLGLTTLAWGAVMALAAVDLPRLAAALVIASMGQLLATVGLSSLAGQGAAVYYLLQSTAAGSALFLVVALIISQRPRLGAALWPGESLRQGLWLGVPFLLLSLAYVGLPPTGGFVGKLLVLEAAWADPRRVAFWSVTLVSSAVLLVALARAGSLLFWKVGTAAPEGAPAHPAQLAALWLPVVAVVGLMLFGEPVLRYAASAASQAADVEAHRSAVTGDAVAVDARRRSYP
jgi:multicomponent K+:H+ antiporter subunit D